MTPELKIKKAEAYKKLANATREKVNGRLQQASPSLFWALNYHRNTRLEKMDFTDMAYLSDLYTLMTNSPKFAVEKAVQTGLSEMYIVESHREASLGMTVMYVLPKYESRNRFVSSRIYKLHTRVPQYMAITKTRGAIHRTSMTYVGKGVIMYSGSNVESEFIETPADSVFVDEKDRCNLVNLLLLPDRYSASPYGHHREISNPTIEGFGIDARFLESTQRFWFIRCPACRELFIPDFFENVVRQTGTFTYEPLDKKWEPGKPMSIIHSCGKAVNRLSVGEWVPKFPGRTWEGVRISRVFVKTTPVDQMFFDWVQSVGNSKKEQVFFNSYLGSPYTSKGARIDKGLLRQCERNYGLPVPEITGAVIMGIDVGAVFHYVVREIVKDDGVEVRRLVDVGTCATKEDLKSKIRRWKPYVCVIDALPEIHTVIELKVEFKKVFSSHFQSDSIRININKEEREIKMDRTALLDTVKEEFDKEVLLLPKGSEFLDGGDYQAQVTSSTRILDVNETNPEKSRYVWVASGTDHYLFAEAYCTQAYMMLPNTRLAEYYGKVADELMAGEAIEGVDEDKAKEIQRLQGMDANSVLRGIQQSFGKKPESGV
jgi:hypothetical protein